MGGCPARDCAGERDSCIGDCWIWAFFGGFEICAEDCLTEYVFCEATN